MSLFPVPASAALLLALLAFPSGRAQASLLERPQPAASESAQVPSTVPPAPLPASKPAFPPKVERSALSRPASVREEITALARRGRLDSAYALGRSALETDPENPFLLLTVGKLSPDGRESSEYFKKAIKAAPASPEAEESHFRLGQFNYAAGKYYLAIPNFRDYLRLFPNGDWKEPAHYWMGNACLSLAQARPDRAAYLDSGAAWFQKLLDKSRPEDYYHSLALEGLAKAKAAQGDREGAWQAALTALDKAPEEEQSPLLLLAAQLRQGVDRQAEKGMMSRLVARYPQSPEARYLRKLNAGVDTSRWRSGSGLPRPALPPAKDSLARAQGRDSSKLVTETSALPQPPGGGGKGFTLQLGAFSQSANAKSMVANLAKLGLAPELVESDRGGKPIYQVRLGRFATPEEASEFARANLKPHRFLSQPVPVEP